jgi:uncharacterized protein YihD (DUF1040 family)
MRDPKRIDIVLQQLATLWKETPDLRLGQMILNVMNDVQLYYIEDVDLISTLEHHYRSK